MRYNKIISDISLAETLSEVLDKWRYYSDDISGCRLIFAGEGKNHFQGLDAYRNFGKSVHLRSLFHSDKIFFIDNSILKQHEKSKQIEIPIDYSICFETNSASHLKALMEGSRDKIITELAEAIDEIIRNDYHYDYAFYLIENAKKFSKVCNNENETASTFAKVKAMELFRTLNRDKYLKEGIFCSIFDDETLAREACNSISSVLIQEDAPFQKVHETMYLLLLKMSIIHLSSNRNYRKKAAEFIEFMMTELKTIFVRELVIAVEFFKSGQNLSFFSRIQRKCGEVNALKALSNMAWDLTYMRFLEKISETGMGLNARYFVPFALSCDNDLMELFDLYPIKMCFFTSDNPMPIPLGKKSINTYLIENDCYDENIWSEYRTRPKSNKRLDVSRMICDIESMLEPMVRNN